MTVEIGTLRVANATTTGNQSLTGLGFQPKCAIWTTTFSDNVAGSSNNHNCWSIGFVDEAGAERCVTISDQHNQATTHSHRRHLNDEVICRLKPASATGDVRAEASHVSFDVDGATINWGVADANAKHIQGIFFAGDHADWQTQVGEVEPADGDGGTTDEDCGSVGSEWIPDLIFVASIQRPVTAWDGDHSNAVVSFGVFYSAGGSSEQHSLNWLSLDGQGTSGVQAALDTNYALATMTGSALGAGHEISTTATGFRVTTRERNANNTGQDFVYLAIKFGDGMQVDVGTYNLPTLASPTTVSGVGFEPAHLVSVQTHVTSTDALLTDNTAAPFGIGYSDGSGEKSLSVSSEDGVTTSNCQSLYDATFHATYDGAGQQEGSVSSLNSDGFEITWATVTVGSTGNSIYLALKELQSLSPGATAVSLSAPAASVDLGTLTIAVSFTRVSLSAPAASVSLGALTITPGATAVSLGAPTASVGLGTLTITTGFTRASLSAPTASVSLGALTVTAGASTASVTAPAASVDLGALTLSPGASTISATAPTATVTQDQLLIVGATAISLSVPAASVAGSGTATVVAGTTAVDLLSPRVTVSVPVVLRTVQGRTALSAPRVKASQATAPRTARTVASAPSADVTQSTIPRVERRSSRAPRVKEAQLSG